MANYINNKDFQAALVKHFKEIRKAKRLKQPRPKLPDYISNCFLLLARNMIRHPHFNRYTWHDDMMGDAIENCYRYYDRYNVESKNPFAYYTRIIYRAFQRRVKEEKTELYVRYKSTIQAGVLDEAHQSEIKELTDDSSFNQFEIYENICEFVDKFEKADAERKKRKREKREEKKALTIKAKK